MAKQHHEMPVEIRAKQFMPFAAVAGLEEALARKLEEHKSIFGEKQRSDERQAANGK